MVRDTCAALGLMCVMSAASASFVHAETEAAENISSGTWASALETAEIFTERDLAQSADTAEAVSLQLQSGEDQTITEEGVYILSGTAENATVIIDTPDDAKVQLVLDGIAVSNDDFPCIYVKNADKVFVTTTDSENQLEVTGAFTADGETNTDAAIFSRDDLVLGGAGTLTVSSTDNGISSKDDLKITGGTLVISSAADALEANESIAMAGGTVAITSSGDGLHAENDEDSSTGWVYIAGGTLQIEAGDDAIHATTILQIDGGSLSLSGAECLEATWIQINDGEMDIHASDDAVNAAAKSDICLPTLEINGGGLTIAVGAGDTDAIDVNGNLYIRGGSIDITAQSPFDYDGQAEFSGGTLIVNGVETTTLTNQMMGGGMGGMGGHGGMNPMNGAGAVPGMENAGSGNGNTQEGFMPGGHGGMGGRGGMNGYGNMDNSGNMEGFSGTNSY